jgi:hypothetical protein
VKNKFNISNETRVIANYYIYIFNKFNEFSKNILLPLLVLGVAYLIFKDGYKNVIMQDIYYGLSAIFLAIIAYVSIFGFMSMIVVACDNLNKLTQSMTSSEIAVKICDQQFELLNESLRSNNQIEVSDESTDGFNGQIKSIKVGKLYILLTAYSHKGSDEISTAKCVESHYLKGYALYYDEELKKATFYKVTPRIELCDSFEPNEEIGKLLIGEVNQRLFPTISIPRKSSLAENLISNFNEQKFKSVNAYFDVVNYFEYEFSIGMKLLEGTFNNGFYEFYGYYEILKKDIVIENVEFGDEVLSKILKDHE